MLHCLKYHREQMDDQLASYVAQHLKDGYDSGSVHDHLIDHGKTLAEAKVCGDRSPSAAYVRAWTSLRTAVVVVTVREIRRRA